MWCYFVGKPFSSIRYQSSQRKCSPEVNLFHFIVYIKLIPYAELLFVLKLLKYSRSPNKIYVYFMCDGNLKYKCNNFLFIQKQ